MQTPHFYDHFRGRNIQAAPEEHVRYALVDAMVTTLGYPKSLITIESVLADLCQPHESPPHRRVDIVVHIPQSETMHPLLLVECKAVPLKDAMLDQVFGYNHYLKAPFVALVNQQQTIYASYDSLSGKYTIDNGFPTYADLLSRVVEGA